MPRRRPRAGRARRRAAAVFGAIAATAALATPAAPASAQPIYGVVPQNGALPTFDDLALMPSGGVNSIRLMAHWPTLEPVDGVFDWSSLDGMVRESVNRGVQPLVFLYGTPDWAAHQDRRSCGRDCSIFPPSSPSTRAAFADFARSAVERYGPDGDFWKPPVQATTTEVPPDSGGSDSTLPVVCDPLPICPPPPPPPPPSDEPPPTEAPCSCTVAHPIRTWQIWNEQNSPKFFAPAPDVGTYAAMLTAAGNAIHQADPGADVILGGMWGPQSAKKIVVPIRRYLTDLYGVNGIAKSFDSIALHPYSQTVAGSLGQLQAAHQVAKRFHDGGAGMWITELGWAASGPKQDPYVKGLRGQARILTTAMKSFEQRQRRFHIRGVFWYSWRDQPGGDALCRWCGHAGLRAKDGSAKPAWRAFKRVATR